MKRNLKFLLSLLFIMIFLMSSSFVSAGNNNGNNSKLKHESEFAKNEKVHQIINNDEKYVNLYGGSFIDQDGILNVNLVDNVEEFSNKVGIDSIKYSKVKFSRKELNDHIKHLSNYMLEYNIDMIELDEIENKVKVYVRELDELKKAAIKKLNPSEAIELIDQNLSLQLTADVINGKQAVTGSEGSTIGLAAKNASGNKGYLIPGHISAGVGTSVTYEGNTAGTIESKAFGNRADASFVKAQTGFWSTDYVPTKKFMNGDTYNTPTMPDSSQFIVGQGIDAYGKVSLKQSGKILSTNVSYTVGNVTITNAVKADYKAIKGDSGAAVVFTKAFYFTRHVMGMQSASALDTNGNWVSGSYTLFTRIDYIFSALNLSDI